MPVDVGQPVGRVVTVIRDGRRRARPRRALRLAQPVAYRIVSVAEVAAIGVVGFLEAIQRVVDVGDGSGHHRAGHRADVGRAAALEGVEVQRAAGGGVHPGHCAETSTVDAPRAVVEAGEGCLLCAANPPLRACLSIHFAPSKKFYIWQESSFTSSQLHDCNTLECVVRNNCPSNESFI